MPSIQSKAYNFMLRHKHWFQLKLRKERFGPETSLNTFREQCEFGAARYTSIPKGVNIQAETISEMRAEWLIPEGAVEDKIILYVHGGGYVSGTCRDHWGFVAKFAKYCGYKNIMYDYRLAPEDPYPAALEDSVTAYEWLLKKGIRPEHVIVVGESAGGGLTLALLLALKDRKITLPAAAVAISPWTDLTCASGSHKTKRKLSVAPHNSWNVFSAHYVGKNPADLPFISPLYGDLAGLPPIFISAGTDDELFEDGQRFYEKAKAAGVDIKFREGTGMVHCYPLLAPYFPEATDAMNEICAFIKERIG